MSDRAKSPLPEALEFAQEVQKLDQDTRTHIRTVMHLLKNGDVRAKAITAMLGRGEITMEESIEMMEAYIATLGEGRPPGATLH